MEPALGQLRAVEERVSVFKEATAEDGEKLLGRLRGLMEASYAERSAAEAYVKEMEEQRAFQEQLVWCVVAGEGVCGMSSPSMIAAIMLKHLLARGVLLQEVARLVAEGAMCGLVSSRLPEVVFKVVRSAADEGLGGLAKALYEAERGADEEKAARFLYVWLASPVDRCGAVREALSKWPRGIGGLAADELEDEGTFRALEGDVVAFVQRRVCGGDHELECSGAFGAAEERLSACSLLRHRLSSPLPERVQEATHSIVKEHWSGAEETAVAELLSNALPLETEQVRSKWMRTLLPLLWSEHAVQCTEALWEALQCLEVSPPPDLLDQLATEAPETEESRHSAAFVASRALPPEQLGAYAERLIEACEGDPSRHESYSEAWEGYFLWERMERSEREACWLRAPLALTTGCVATALLRDRSLLTAPIQRRIAELSSAHGFENASCAAPFCYALLRVLEPEAVTHGDEAELMVREVRDSGLVCSLLDEWSPEVMSLLPLELQRWVAVVVWCVAPLVVQTEIIFDICVRAIDLSDWCQDSEVDMGGRPGAKAEARAMWTLAGRSRKWMAAIAPV